MIGRVTDDHLREQVNVLNSLVGAHKHEWSRGFDHLLAANVGTYFIDENGSGVSLDKMVTDGGSVLEIIGRTTKRDLLEKMQAFAMGLQAGMTIATQAVDTQF